MAVLGVLEKGGPIVEDLVILFIVRGTWEGVWSYWRTITEYNTLIRHYGGYDMLWFLSCLLLASLGLASQAQAET